MKTIIAIDPGASGGIVHGFAPYKEPVAVTMPETVHDLAEFLRSASFEGQTHAFVELVGGYAGGVGAPGSAMFNFGQNFGQILGILASFKVPFTLVRPQAWQKALSLGTSKGLTKTEWKNKLKAKAQQLYPNNKITLATSDAFLIYHAAVTGAVKE